VTKDEIRLRLQEVLAKAYEYDPIGYLEYDIQAMKKYISKKNDNKQFDIIKLQSRDNSRLRPNLKDGSATVYFPPGGEHFKNRAVIAFGLGMVADHYLRDSPFVDGDGARLSVEPKRIIYFAKKLLQKRTQVMNSPMLPRNAYALNHDEIEKMLEKIFGISLKSHPLESREQRKIDDFLEAVHNEMDADSGLLAHSSRLTATYVKDTYKLPSVRIVRNFSDNVDRYKCSTMCFLNYNFSMRCSGKNRNNIELQRVLIGHELGNIVCHWKPDDNGTLEETQEQRKEATYFAKLLLEHRAMLYLDGESDPRYLRSKETIKQSIREIYPDQPWIDWVTSD